MTFPVGTDGLIATMADPEATGTGPPLPKLVPALVTLICTVAPLQLLGMLDNATALMLPPETEKFVTTPLSAPQAATLVEPATSALEVGELVLAPAPDGRTAATNAHANVMKARRLMRTPAGRCPEGVVPPRDSPRPLNRR